MNLRQLKAFQAVCRTGNITRASELIHLSQPALTRQIQELESYCGCKLFERTRHGIVLTDEGELLQVRAEEMLSLAERTRRELKEAGGFTGGIVRIGCVESSAAQELSQLLAKWQQSTPGVRKAEFELYSADGDDIRSSLDEERLDVGILLEPVETAKYDSLPLSSADRWGVVVRSDSPEAQLPALTQDGWLGTDSCERKTACFRALWKVSGPMPQTTGDPKSQIRSCRQRFRTAKIIKGFRLAKPPLK